MRHLVWCGAGGWARGEIVAVVMVVMLMMMIGYAVVGAGGKVAMAKAFL